MTEPEQHDDTTAEDHQNVHRATGPYRVPIGDDFLGDFATEHVTVTDPVAAGHWDARVWRRLG